MRTITGPICEKCNVRVYRKQWQNEHGYVHASWEHLEATDCDKAKVNWIVKE